MRISSASSLILIVSGDFNFDGLVNGLDFLEWQRDPSVGDLADFEANFGPPASVVAAAAVPEPATAVMALLLVGALRSRRDARRGSIQSKRVLID